MPNGFASNWTYLKTELNWLERVLMVAVSRQQQERKAIDRIAQSQADRVSAHWWKGLMSLNGKGAYDEHRPPASSQQKTGYQQKLQARIEASRQNGVVLLVPLLCDRLQLTLFEKNLLLMAIAPEVNRRYGRLYQYLQGTTDSDLPSLELALRLLCRNDSDWQAARQRLSDCSPLLKHHLIQLIRPPGGTFLSASVRIMPQLVELLLSDQSAVPRLDALLDGSAFGGAAASGAPALPIEFSAPAHISTGFAIAPDSPRPEPERDALADPGSPAAWDDLVLPAPLLSDLLHLSDRLAAQAKVDDEWGFQGQDFAAVQPGTMAILAGDRGSGKTLAAAAIATGAGATFKTCNLRDISASRWSDAMATLDADCPTVLLIKSSHRWFGPQASVDGLREWIAQRMLRPTLTLLSVHRVAAISPQWRHRASMLLSFPLPTESDRLQLWKQAFPKSAPLGRLRWTCLAKLPLTGGNIVMLARDAAIVAATEPSERVMQRHVSAALRRHGYKLPRKP